VPTTLTRWIIGELITGRQESSRFWRRIRLPAMIYCKAYGTLYLALREKNRAAALYGEAYAMAPDATVIRRR
jgi:hypothetical protein